MDCRTAEQLLPYRRPAAPELAPGEVQALEAHLADCPRCTATAQSERRLDAHFSQAIGAVPVPSRLRERLLGRLRRDRAVRHRLWFYQGAIAAAACLLLAVSVYLLVANRGLKPTPIDFNGVAESVSEAHTAEQVQEWLDWRVTDALYLPAALKDKWNFNLLEHIYVQQLQGHAVPTLVFEKDTARVKVYLVRKGQYNPDTVAPSFNSGNSRAPWVLGGNGEDEYTAVIVVERGDWKPFQIEPR